VADHVVCVSAWTREQLLGRHPELDPDRVSVVHNGVDHVQPRALDAVSQAWLRSLGLPERWVLFAGALDARKNVELVLEALERLGPRAPTLVLAGQRWYGSGAIERRIGALRAVGFDIRPLGYLAEPLLWALMAAAPVFVFPSRDEGFGLPPLEAMALGAPVVVSTAAALPEVCGDAAIQVDPDDAGALATALQRLLDEPEERRRRAAAGRARAAGFRWDAVAAHLVQVYRRLLHT
jgi:glycosyltransferase involved in cell wall biosynthesis